MKYKRTRQITFFFGFGALTAGVALAMVQLGAGRLSQDPLWMSAVNLVRQDPAPVTPPTPRIALTKVNTRAIVAWQDKVSAMDKHSLQRDETVVDGLDIASSKHLFDELFAARGSIATRRIRDHVLAQAVKDPNIARVAQRTLASEAFARRAFGAHQGEARHYAAHVLGHLAKEGNPAPLLETTRALVADLQQQDRVSAGRAEDLRSLVERVSALTKPQDLGPELLADIGYDLDLPEALKRHLQESVLFGQAKHSDLIVAMHATEKLFKGNR